MADRITAPVVKELLDNHLQFHELKLNPKVHNHQEILFGEKGDDGMCADVKEIKRGYTTMKSIGVAILITLLGNMILLVTRFM